MTHIKFSIIEIILRRIIVFILLMIFWILFSGHFDSIHLTYGAICCGLVSWASGDLLLRDIGKKGGLSITMRFFLYLPWLVYQIVLSNFYVVKLILFPKTINPQITEYRSTLKSELSIVTFANSITLTPGTITMDIDDDTFYVHSISQKVADDLKTGTMESKIASVFSETRDDKVFKWIITFILLMLFWVIFSGHFDKIHLTYGVICCSIVAFFSSDLLIRDTNATKKYDKTWRFTFYIPWLIYQVILANFHVVKLVFSPKKIVPQVVRYQTFLKNELSLVTFANSITLTPGTITMEIEDDIFHIHALSQKVVDDLNSGEMEEKIANVFFENKKE